ncbi:MAG: rhodanese-like domain-containing protein [Clostridia bacterium]
MKTKVLALVISASFAIALISGCAAEEIVPSEETAIDGRIIDIEAGSKILIRNEEDTNIYYNIDISGGVLFTEGVDTALDVDNVISADVQMINADSLPKETTLVRITGNKTPAYTVIDAVRAKQMMDEGGATVIDVRTITEYSESHIPDSYNVPLDEIGLGIDRITADRDAVILVYCKSGNRSKVAARMLSEMGYTNVYDFGGIVDWPYETTSY